MDGGNTGLNEVISQKFELEAGQEVSESELLDILTERVAYLLDHNADFLFSLLYRLDVDEAKINVALSPTNPFLPGESLARLIIERQKQRIKTKEHYRNT